MHIISDFTGKLSEQDKENIEYKNDHELSEIYKDKLHGWLLVRSGTDMPEQGTIDTIYEPYAEVEIVGPKDYSGNIMELSQDHR